VCLPQRGAQGGKKTKVMTQCDSCFEWTIMTAQISPTTLMLKIMIGSANIAEIHRIEKGIRDGRQDGKKPKKRYFKDTPKAQGAEFGGPALVQFSAPRAWDGKVEETKERSRRNSIKKRKLQEAVEVMIDTREHHLVDAEGMAGLEARPMGDALIDEMVVAGIAIKSSEDG
jgi:hypothetical protein